jgi:hypothetical protein
MSTRATPARSKQQSDTSPSAQNELPDPNPAGFTYFLDESITITSLIHAMRSANLDVKVLREEFHAGAKDEDWLPVAAAKGWILFTKDDRWRFRRAEKDILINANARAFVFVSKSARAHEIVETIMACLGKIARIIATEPAPFVAHILLSKHINVVFPNRSK